MLGGAAGVMFVMLGDVGVHTVKTHKTMAVCAPPMCFLYIRKITMTEKQVGVGEVVSGEMA